MDKAVVVGFGEAVLAAGRKRPKQVVRDAVRTWNVMAKTIEGSSA
jgi:hypothetical protein